VLPLCGRFRYGSSCVLLRIFLLFITTVRVFRYGSSCIWPPILPTGLALHWVPLLPTHLAEPLVTQPWPGSSCVSLRLFVRLGAHVAKSPCITFGRPSYELALHCIQVPKLGEAVLKNLPPSKNWFLSVLRLVFLPSAPFVWLFSLCVFVHFVTTIRAFCYGSSCVWAPILTTGLAFHLGAPLSNLPCLALRLGAHLANSPCVVFRRPTLVRPYSKIYLQDKIGSYPSSNSSFFLVLPLCGRFHYVSSCVSLRPFMRFVTTLRAFGHPSCQPALHYIWVPLLPTCLALSLVVQPWPGSSCVSFRLFVRLGAHVAKSPCVAFGCPSCELTLRCVRVPNLGEVVLKNLPPSQNWFLSILRFDFLPSAPLCGCFRYGCSCVSLQLFVHFVMALRAFGRPSFRLVLHFIWVPLLPTRLTFPLVAQPWPVSSCILLRLFVRLGAHVAKSPCIALGHPSCELALHCIRAPNLGEAVLKNLPPSQNWFLSIIRLVFFPSAPLCGCFRYGSLCISLRPFVHFVTALRVFHCGSSFISLRIFVRLGAHLSNWPCIAFGCPSFQLAFPCPWSGSSCVFITDFGVFGHPSCELTLPCIRAPNLGEAILKNLPPSQNCFLSVIRLVFLPSDLLCGRFRCGSSCVLLCLFVRFVAALRAFRYDRSYIWGPHIANWPCIAFGFLSCQLNLPCPWSPNLGQAPCVFRYGYSCIWAPMLQTRLALRSGAHIANSPYVVFGCPTLVRLY
jgi:hypothetical protein